MWPQFDKDDQMKSLYRQIALSQIAITAILAKADPETAEEFYKAMGTAPAADPKMAIGAHQWTERVRAIRKVA